MSGPADRPLVALGLPPDADVVAALERRWDAGDAVLPLPADLPAPAVQRLLAALRPTAIADADGITALPGGAPVAADVALVVATSGSTGEPKGVELTAAALQASAAASLRRIGARRGERWLCCLPVAHIAGLQVLLRARLLGTAPVVHPGFDVATVAAQRDVEHVSLVPTMLRRLLDAGADLRRFRTILLGGAAAPPALLDRARAAGARIVVTYGMTETCGGCVYDGVPLDGVAVDVDDDGRIRLRGPVLFRSYRGGDGTALGDGWFRTGDLGRVDADGRLVVLGRADDVVVTGGHNVSTDAVAALLEGHPDVHEAAVVGRADPEWGQRVVAVVVAPGAAPTLPELRDLVRRQAPAYAAPRELLVVAALPRLANGKLDRRRLTDLVASASQPAVG